MTALYTLRPATLDDLGPMMAIGHEGLRPYVELYRGWDPHREEAGFREHFEPARISIIQIDGEDVGYIKVNDDGEYLFVEGIYIHRDARSKGLGTMVLRDLALSTQKALRLTVYKNNPALQLYHRLGFVEISEDEQQVTMESSNSIS